MNDFLNEFVILCSTTQQPLLKQFVSESDWFSTVKWISSNRLACGYESGELKILEVETDDNDATMLEGHDVNDIYLHFFIFDCIILGIYSFTYF